ncbi:MAG: cytochrome c biogenesis protein CcsA [Bacteroidaceae bacterium]|nr:cytochrome c biogenesis protein CcsA [Bacteroidaceae bacterium]
MKNRLSDICTSFKTSVVLMLIYIIGLATATWIEKYHGSSVAEDRVYHAPLFLLLQLLLVLNFMGVVMRRRLLRKSRLGFILTHGALIVILFGASVTFLFGKEGYMHLREGEISNHLVIRNGKTEQVTTLPFSIELKDFILTRYPGSSSPSAYESLVSVHSGGRQHDARIYMNNVLDVQGYRFFQASYDPDELGSVLAVNHDVAGRTISYAGYLLLGIGLLLFLFMPGSRFYRLKQRLQNQGKSAGLLLLLLVLPRMVTAQESRQEDNFQSVVSSHVVPESHARRFSLLPMQSPDGRMMPVNTFSSEVLRKLHKAPRVCGLNPDQFLLSVLVMPEVWMQIPFIVIPEKDVADRFRLPEDYCSYAQVFDKDGSYKLQAALEEAYRKSPSQRTRFDKDLLKLDERVNIFYQLVNRKMLNLFPLPEDASHRWFAPGDDLSGFTGRDSLFVSKMMDWYLEEAASAMQQGEWSQADSIISMISTYQQAKATPGVDIRPKRMEAEVRYNEMRIFHHCKTAYLILGGLALLTAFGGLSGRKRSLSSIAGKVLTLGIIATVLFHTFGMGLRWYLAGYAPWSNSYETMVYVGWVTVFSGLCFARRNRIALALGTLFGGVILFVSELNWMDPQISQLVPVLKSPWLMYHVAVVVAAYGFFGLSCLLGITNLAMMCFRGKGTGSDVLQRRIQELSLINEMSLWIGLALMAAGIFLGAVWANESWGRYWGWDPKETWALITLLCYAIVTHLHLLPLRRITWWLNWASLIAFSSVLMTFFGVNYLLTGMHSYGSNANAGKIMVPLIVVTVILIPLSVCSYRKSRIE